MTDENDAMTDVLYALAQPNRREIMHLLVSSGELAAGEIAAAFEVTRPAVSQHLKVLRHAGLVTDRADGTRRLYRANTAALEDLRNSLDQLWGAALSRARDLVISESDQTQAEAG